MGFPIGAGAGGGGGATYDDSALRSRVAAAEERITAAESFEDQLRADTVLTSDHLVTVAQANEAYSFPGGLALPDSDTGREITVTVGTTASHTFRLQDLLEKTARAPLQDLTDASSVSWTRGGVTFRFGRTAAGQALWTASTVGPYRLDVTTAVVNVTAHVDEATATAKGKVDLSQIMTTAQVNALIALGVRNFFVDSVFDQPITFTANAGGDVQSGGDASNLNLDVVMGGRTWNLQRIIYDRDDAVLIVRFDNFTDAQLAALNGYNIRLGNGHGYPLAHPGRADDYVAADNTREMQWDWDGTAPVAGNLDVAIYEPLSHENFVPGGGNENDVLTKTAAGPAWTEPASPGAGNPAELFTGAPAAAVAIVVPAIAGLVANGNTHAPAWSAWTDIISYNIGADKGGFYILGGALNCITDFAPGGGNRIYLESRITRVRAGESDLILASVDAYLRNVDTGSNAKEWTIRTEKELANSDQIKLQVRVRRQANNGTPTSNTVSVTATLAAASNSLSLLRLPEGGTGNAQGQQGQGQSSTALDLGAAAPVSLSSGQSRIALNSSTGANARVEGDAFSLAAAAIAGSVLRCRVTWQSRPTGIPSGQEPELKLGLWNVADSAWIWPEQIHLNYDNTHAWELVFALPAGKTQFKFIADLNPHAQTSASATLDIQDLNYYENAGADARTLESFGRVWGEIAAKLARRETLKAANAYSDAGDLVILSALNGLGEQFARRSTIARAFIRAASSSAALAGTAAATWTDQGRGTPPTGAYWSLAEVPSGTNNIWEIISQVSHNGAAWVFGPWAGFEITNLNTQYSIDGLTLWHSVRAQADRYERHYDSSSGSWGLSIPLYDGVSPDPSWTRFFGGPIYRVNTNETSFWQLTNTFDLDEMNLLKFRLWIVDNSNVILMRGETIVTPFFDSAPYNERTGATWNSTATLIMMLDRAGGLRVMNANSYPGITRPWSGDLVGLTFKMIRPNGGTARQVREIYIYESLRAWQQLRLEVDFQ